MDRLEQQLTDQVYFNNVNTMPKRLKTTTTPRYNACYHFESFPNEIIYEIFEYLDAFHIYQSFWNLNTRFQELLMLSNFPIKFNTTNIPKSLFQDYFEQFIKSNRHRVLTMNLSNSFITELLVKSSKGIKRFTNLEKLLVDNINPTYVEDIIAKLSSLPKLSSLILKLNNENSQSNISFARKLPLRVFKYCVQPVNVDDLFARRSITTNCSSSIEHLVIKNRMNDKDLLIILSHVPQLRRLSVDHLFRYYRRANQNLPNISKNLTDITIKLEHMNFDYFECLIINAFSYVKALTITINDDEKYLNAKRWERLISSYLPHLRIFDIRCANFVINENDENACRSLMDRFSTRFWTERQWFFRHDHNWKGHSNRGVFYSIQPHRRKYYQLRSKDEQCPYIYQSHTSLDSVRYVQIKNISPTDDYSISIPNTTELTISYDQTMPPRLLLDQIGSIVPLSKLTKLVVNCVNIQVFELMEMLCFVPICDTLALNTFSIIEPTSFLLSTNSFDAHMLRRNTIKNLTIKSYCTQQEVEILMQFFPQIQHLSIDVHGNHFSSVLKYLISNHRNTRNLITLRMISSSDVWPAKLSNTIAEVRKSREVAWEVIGYHECFLWL